MERLRLEHLDQRWRSIRPTALTSGDMFADLLPNDDEAFGANSVGYLALVGCKLQVA